jgi:hypothetical protein
VTHAILGIPVVRRLWKKDLKCKAILGYITRPSLKKPK